MAFDRGRTPEKPGGADAPVAKSTFAGAMADVLMDIRSGMGDVVVASMPAEVQINDFDGHKPIDAMLGTGLDQQTTRPDNPTPPSGDITPAAVQTADASDS